MDSSDEQATQTAPNDLTAGGSIAFLGWVLFIIGVVVSIAGALDPPGAYDYARASFSDHMVAATPGLIISGIGLLAAGVGNLVGRD